MTNEEYTDAQATDEAVLLLTRKLRRLHPDVYADVMAKLPSGALDALMLADQRADKLRQQDRDSGTERTYRDIWATDDDDEDGA